MGSLVQAFNDLPRPESVPSGLPNHWHFTVRHVPLDPPGDLVQIVHHTSEFIRSEGPAEILSLPTPTAKADVIVPLLLQAFATGTSRGPNGETLSDIPPSAPWTWATKDASLVEALEAKLTALGVRRELCNVQLGSTEENDISDQVWTRCVGSLMKLMGKDAATKKAASGRLDDQNPAVCNGCKEDFSSRATPLQRCSGCRSASYCSRTCQKAHWKEHKKQCRKPPGVGQPSPAVYYNSIAQTVPAAKELAESMNLTLPSGTSSTVVGIVNPIRRLVTTGKDTPVNLQILLGPGWQSQAAIHETTRLEVLLRPPPGSPLHATTAELDNGAPTWSPRPPSSTENEKIQVVREIQAALRRRMGSRKDPTTADMQAVLAGFGGNWVDRLPMYQLAVNAMDQDVPAR